MKGFKSTGKHIHSGHNFPESFGFTSSSGKVQNVGGYTRRAPIRKAIGGKVSGFEVEKGSKDMVYDGDANTVGDQGNAVELRSKSISEQDKDYGGKGPLRPGFALGGGVRPALGMAGPARMGLGNVPRVGLPRAVTNRPMMRAKGGSVGKPPMKLHLKKGALHSALGVPQGEKIGSKALHKAADSSSPLMRKRAQFAINAAKWNHKAQGGAFNVPKMRAVAHEVVGEHVKTPAPKGHKGLGNLCK